ncbi:MAG: DUF2029 domain-containing protein [Sphingobacteriaceae bacterium]|nr:DUF2029 domain-containing protein [Sphingobacteriaceae bacterium]
MGLFYYLSDWLGLSLWNLLNGLVFLYAITTLPGFTNKKTLYLLLFVIVELVLSIQNCQTNSLLAGFTILAFTSLEKGNAGKAAFYICCGIFIKIFAIVACLLFLFYPKKPRFILFMLLWSTVFFLLPAIVIGIPNLIYQYKNWISVINGDLSGNIALYKVGENFSLYGFLEILIGTSINKTIVLVCGIVMLLSPLAFIKKYKFYNFRMAFLCLILIWMVIFNHKAESPSYIIAITGIGIWCLSKENSKLALILLFSSLFFTSLFFTDLVPIALKQNLSKPLIKACMSCVVLLVIAIELTIKKNILEDNIEDKKIK